MSEAIDGVTVKTVTRRGGVLVEFSDGREAWIPQAAIHDDSEVWQENQTGKLVICGWYTDKLEAKIGSVSTSTAEESVMGRPLQLTNDQRLVVNRAILKARKELGDMNAKEGRIIELICADFIGGA